MSANISIKVLVRDRLSKFVSIIILKELDLENEVVLLSAKVEMAVAGVVCDSIEAVILVGARLIQLETFFSFF